MADDVTAQRLQAQATDRRQDGTGDQPPPRHVGHRQKLHGREKDAEVDEGRDDEGDDLRGHAVARACRRQPGEHGRPDHARPEYE